MSNWTTEIGNFPKLQAAAIANAIGNRMNYWMTSIKDDMCKDMEQPNEYTQYRTIEQLLNPPTTTEETEDGKTKEKKDKLTWHGVRTIAKKGADNKSLKDEEGNVVYEEVEGDWPMSNFSTVTTPSKRALVYLLNRYMFETHNAFHENGDSFGNDALKVVSDHSMAGESPSIAAMVIAVAAKCETMCNIINDDNCSDDKHKSDDVNNKINNAVTDYFKVGTKTPSTQLKVLVDTFVKFLRVLSVFSVNSLFEAHKAINMTFLKVQLRNAFSLVQTADMTITPEFMEKLDSYIESWDKQNKAEAAKRKAEKEANPKKPKSDKGKEEAEEAEADEADEDADAEPEPEPPKKSTKSTKTKEEATKEQTKEKEPTKKTTKETTKEKEPAKETKKTTKKTTKKKDDDFDDVDQDA